MKRNILVVVNTYFQLITVCNLKITELKNDNVDLIITDLSANSDKIIENIRKTNFFKNVFYVEASKIVKNKSKILRLKSLFQKNECIKEHIDISKDKYDYLMFFNLDLFTFGIYNMLKQKIQCWRFEEGYISYLFNTFNKKILAMNRFVDAILFRKNIEKSIKKYYFYNPELVLFETKTSISRIENLDKKNIQLVECLNTVFGYEKSTEEYKEKYIFFEESFFCDGRDIDDLDLILKIADIVGKDNLLVKLHPRNKIDRFSKYGIKTNKTIGIPWEVIQMNNDFSDKVFLTISSGSVLASRLYFDENIKTFLLFNCTEKMSDMVTKEYLEYLEKVRGKFGLDNFNIPQNKEELFKKLREEKNARN